MDEYYALSICMALVVLAQRFCANVSAFLKELSHAIAE